MRRRRQVEKGDPVARGKVLSAFAEMRSNGFLARANFMCCGSCAWYDLATKASELKDKGRTLNGCVSWHRQAEEWWKEIGRLSIAYGPILTSKYGIVGLPAVVIGDLLRKKLEA